MSILNYFKGARGYYLALAVVAIIALPTLATGFFIDDYAHLMALDGKSPVASPWNVYVFGPGDPEQLKPIIEEGPFPWFTSLNLRVRFFRPLSSLTMMFDRYVLGSAAWAYHLHNIFWYLALLLILAGILRRSFPSAAGSAAIGVLTLFLFAVDEAHWFPVMWWSHRNTLVAATFGFAALLAYVRWRQDEWKAGRILALLFFCLGLFAGETALSILGYFVAFEIFTGSGTLKKRALQFAPPLFVGIIYVAGYSLGGFGVSGTGCYLSPLSNPVEYLTHAPARLLIYVATQFTSLPAELPAVRPQAIFYLAAAGLATLLAVIYLLRKVWPCLTPQEQTGVKWLAAGALLSIPPFLAPFTSCRLLIVPSFGGAAIIAAIIVGARRAIHNRRHIPLRALKTVNYALIGLHLVAPPLLWILLSIGMVLLNNRIHQNALAADLDDTKIAGQEISLLTVPDPAVGLYAPPMRMEMGLPKPAAWRPLTLSSLDFELKRTRENEFELTALNGELLTTLYEQIARKLSDPLPVGEWLDFSKFEACVLEYGKVGPVKVAFQFPASLDDPRYLWLIWRDHRLQQLKMPAVGEKVLLPRAPFF